MPIQLMGKASYLDFVVEIIRRSDDQEGFKALPRRLVVKRTFAWVIRWWRLVRDCEQRITGHDLRGNERYHVPP